MSERALGFRSQRVCGMKLWVCCWHGNENNFYFSNSFHFEGTQEFHKLYANSSASQWQGFFSSGIRSKQLDENLSLGMGGWWKMAFLTSLGTNLAGKIFLVDQKTLIWEGGSGQGDICAPVAYSCRWMAKTTTIL